jgi:hypothetical protein
MKGIEGLSNDGSPYGYYFGKHQNLISPTPIYASNSTTPPGSIVLEANTTYKISNTTHDITKSIIYGNTQILPDYFFNTFPIGLVSISSAAWSNIVGVGTTFTKFYKGGDSITVGTETRTISTISDLLITVSSPFTVAYNGTYTPPLFYTLLNTGGTESTVYKVLSDPLESFEIFQYDVASIGDGVGSLSSVYPKFSAPLFGNVILLYYSATGASRYGKSSGAPVFFGDLKTGQTATDFPLINPVTTLKVALPAGTSTTTVVLNPPVSGAFPTFGTIRIGATQWVYTNAVVDPGVSVTLTGAAGQTLLLTTAGERVDLLYTLNNPKISYYDDWQVSNADEEFVTLSQSSYFTTSTPSLRYCKVEVNGHFDLAFDY